MEVNGGGQDTLLRCWLGFGFLLPDECDGLTVVGGLGLGASSGLDVVLRLGGRWGDDAKTDDAYM
jgi:hypothetical protein